METDDSAATLTLLDHGDLVVWHPEAGCPYHISRHSCRGFERSCYPLAYAAHHWGGSWI